MPSLVPRKTSARCISLVGQRPHGVDRWSSRNIARHVIHHASVPVLLQTGTIDTVESSRRSFGPVIVSLDGSKQAELALDVAIPIARTLGQTVSLVRAVNVPFPESEPSDFAIVSAGDVDAAKSYLLVADGATSQARPECSKLLAGNTCTRR